MVYAKIAKMRIVSKEMVKNIVTARNIVDNQQIFVKCNNVSEALEVAGKLHRIELKERTYVQIRLRGTPCSKKLYKELHIQDIIGKIL